MMGYHAVKEKDKENKPRRLRWGIFLSKDDYTDFKL
jgi:hypothetical protein